MSEQKSQIVSIGLYELDASEPSPERQTDLKNAYAKNVNANKPPYAGVEFWTLGEVQWVIREHGWRGEPLRFTGVRADLQQAGLSGINLSGIRLDRANLSGANLAMTNLDGATLYDADLSSAMLQQANLSGANLVNAHLSKETNLQGVQFDNRSRFADVDWNGVKLSQINWEIVNCLGDDYYADLRRLPDGTRPSVSAQRSRYRTAVRANRQLALALREQGLNEHADRFNFRAQVMARKATLRDVFVPAKVPKMPFPWAVERPPALKERVKKIGSYLGLVTLELLAGYGYRPIRSLITYALVVLAFAVGYFLMRENVHPALNPIDSLIFSVTSFHGRGFMPGENVNLHNPLTIAAAGEAIIGLLIEITFIATFTQRFFAR